MRVVDRASLKFPSLIASCLVNLQIPGNPSDFLSYSSTACSSFPLPLSLSPREKGDRTSGARRLVLIDGTMEESFDIKWENHSREACEEVSRLRRDGAFTDVVLFVEEEVFKAHRVILAACSAYFEKVCTFTTKW